MRGKAIMKHRKKKKKKKSDIFANQRMSHKINTAAGYGRMRAASRRNTEDQLPDMIG